MSEPDTYAPRTPGDPLDASLLHADTLTASLVDRQARSMWELMSRVAGIPLRRWLRFHPLAGGGAVVRRVDGAVSFDVASWQRFAALMPGAVALPGRTAAACGIDATTLRAPDRRLRLLDLWSARHQRRRQLRRERTLTADLARWEARIDAMEVLAMPAPDLADYARAARIDQALTMPSEAAAGVTASLGRFDALARAARPRSAGDVREGDERTRRLDEAWHAARELQRRQLTAVAAQVDALGERLVAAGLIESRARVREHTLPELLAVARGAAPPTAPPDHSST